MPRRGFLITLHSMGLFRKVLPAMLLLFPACFSFIAAAQDMDAIEGVYRQQYEQYTAQETSLQQQMDALVRVKSQVDDLIAQVSGAPTTSYNQEAARYRQLHSSCPLPYSTAWTSRPSTSRSRKCGSTRPSCAMPYSNARAPCLSGGHSKGARWW